MQSEEEFIDRAVRVLTDPVYAHSLRQRVAAVDFTRVTDTQEAKAYSTAFRHFIAEAALKPEVPVNCDNDDAQGSIELPLPVGINGTLLRHLACKAAVAREPQSPQARNAFGGPFMPGRPVRIRFW